MKSILKRLLVSGYNRGFLRDEFVTTPKELRNTCFHEDTSRVRSGALVIPMVMPVRA